MARSRRKWVPTEHRPRRWPIFVTANYATERLHISDSWASWYSRGFRDETRCGLYLGHAYLHQAKTVDGFLNDGLNLCKKCGTVVDFRAALRKRNLLYGIAEANTEAQKTGGRITHEVNKMWDRIGEWIEQEIEICCVMSPEYNRYTSLLVKLNNMDRAERHG
jgi:hypothetical protein